MESVNVIDVINAFYGSYFFSVFRILEPYPSKDIELDLSHVVSH